MRATKYFSNSTEMADFAKEFRHENSQSKWYIRTALPCDHRVNEQRKGMILVDNETIIQRLITCKVCFNAQNQKSHE